MFISGYFTIPRGGLQPLFLQEIQFCLIIQPSGGNSRMFLCFCAKTMMFSLRKQAYSVRPARESGKAYPALTGRLPASTPRGSQKVGRAQIVTKAV